MAQPCPPWVFRPSLKTLDLAGLRCADGWLPAAVAAVPGSGQNAIVVTLECDDGNELSLISQAHLNGRFAAAHIIGSNRPVTLVSLSFVVSIEGVVVDRGSFEHAHPQQGQPIVSCTGFFEFTDPATGALLRVDLESTGSFPAGH
ncbi:MAG: hypothetical protein H0U86_04440 [Chloroflexi bacterium]|nr:hypothetical protein [Chloroflexota bacterium]